MRLDYFRYDVTTRKTRPLLLTVPARPGCGLVEKDRTQGEGESHTSREVVATRHDGCGVFQARFDWAGNSLDRPVIQPVK